MKFCNLNDLYFYPSDSPDCQAMLQNLSMFKPVFEEVTKNIYRKLSQQIEQMNMENALSRIKSMADKRGFLTLLKSVYNAHEVTDV